MNIKNKRKSLGLTQMDVAELMEISRNRLIEVERNPELLENFKYAELKKLSDLYEVSISELVGEKQWV